LQKLQVDIIFASVIWQVFELFFWNNSSVNYRI